MRIQDIKLGVYEKAIPLQFDWPKKFRTAREAGFDFIELSIDGVEPRISRLNWSREELLAEAASVLEGSGYNAQITDVMAALDGSGAVIGYAMSISTSGSQGEIVIAYGYGVDGTSMGIDILTSSETAGLGSKASEPEFKDQYAGKAVESFSVVKSGAAGDSEINAISGATITSNAVTTAVNAGIVFGGYCAENE